ncbi:MAG: sulfite exporter TauE/SafE family protein [Phycisphaerae bacterium]|nr:sulfite exporter TauE/SafE family protein [Phycisphaerae bacterium]
MTIETLTLVGAAAAAGFIHTVIGPDHYVPFVMMAWARKWSGIKTALITLLCGIGHVASSVILGLVGITMGLAVGNLESIESRRGDVAAWLLLAFGLAYLVWGIRAAIKNKPHTHRHFHPENSEHIHEHTHHNQHTHIHSDKKSITPWVLFTIFIFGPCEILIPLFMYPAAKNSIFDAAIVAVVFGIMTIATMLAMVLAGVKGVSFLNFRGLERYAHAISGATIAICALLIMLGL